MDLSTTDRTLAAGIAAASGDLGPVVRALPEQCFCPPAPFHIQEKQRARVMLQRLVSARRFGIGTGAPYWETVNYAEALLRSAIREHRFAVMKNAPVQTFGSAFARRVAEQAL